MKSTGEEWMGAPAVARKLGIGLVTLYRIIDSGELPAYKISRLVRLRRVEVDAYIERSRVQPGSLARLYDEKTPGLSDLPRLVGSGERDGGGT